MCVGEGAVSVFESYVLISTRAIMHSMCDGCVSCRLFQLRLHFHLIWAMSCLQRYCHVGCVKGANNYCESAKPGAVAIKYVNTQVNMLYHWYNMSTPLEMAYWRIVFLSIFSLNTHFDYNF